MKKNKVTRMCQTCKNSVDGTSCTMQKEMSDKSRIYKNCNGYGKFIPKPPKPIFIKEDNPTNYEELGSFGKFLKKGGHYSGRTGELMKN